MKENDSSRSIFVVRKEKNERENEREREKNDVTICMLPQEVWGIYIEVGATLTIV